jgi:hypothetical protein
VDVPSARPLMRPFERHFLRSIFHSTRMETQQWDRVCIRGTGPRRSVPARGRVRPCLQTRSHHPETTTGTMYAHLGWHHAISPPQQFAAATPEGAESRFTAYVNPLERTWDRYGIVLRSTWDRPEVGLRSSDGAFGRNRKVTIARQFHLHAHSSTLDTTSEQTEPQALVTDLAR